MARRDLCSPAMLVLVLVVLLTQTLASPLSLSTALEVRTWPPTGQPFPRAEIEPSNAERFKRGLRPKTPARLYDPSKVHSAPKARLSNTATAPSQTTGQYFNFDHCYPDKSGSATGVSITASTDQSAVDQCSQKALFDNASTFLVQYISGTQYMCYSGDVGSGASTACTQSNYAEYYLSA